MGHYLSLEREDLVVDGTLLAALPEGLAEYYLALPLAREDGVVSVAMAYPENETALKVLGAVLDSPIVAVRASAEALQATIRRSYQDAAPSHPQILCWSADSTGADLMATTCAALAKRFSGAARVVSAGELPLETVLELAGKVHCRLIILALAPGQPLSPLLQRATAPLLLLRGRALPARRVLLALRGYAADRRMLDWLAPLLQEPAAITLMPLPQTKPEEMRLLIPLNGSGKYRPESYLRHPTLQAARTRVRYRQGPAGRQVADELRAEPYDLLALSAEGYGQYAGEVLRAVEAEPAAANTALFLLRPPAPYRA